jgi:hypothetical protein
LGEVAMSAHDVWSELVAGDWAAISQWRVDGRAEDLFLDFKRAAIEAGRQDDGDDKKNLAKEMSGFGNWEGGVIVFGAEITKRDGADVLHRLNGVGGNLKRYEEQMRVRARGATFPPLAGMDVRAFEDPGRPGDGVVAVYVPFSDGGPYRAEGHPEVSGRYYVRTTSDTMVMPHPLLAAMFGRRPPPRLRVGIEQKDKSPSTIWVHVENAGRGAAAGTFVRLKVRPGQNPDSIHAIGSWVDRCNDVRGAGWDIAFGHPTDELLFPGESRVAGVYRQSANERTIKVRVDCVNGQPVEITRTVTLEVGQIEWFESPA